MSAGVKENGSALPIALILLAVLAVLGLTGMRTAAIETAMAGNDYYARSAFEAAETGIAILLERSAFRIETPEHVSIAHHGSADIAIEASARFVGTTLVPAGGFSLGIGEDAFEALHFEIVSTAAAPRGATATHRQGFYVVDTAGPR